MLWCTSPHYKCGGEPVTGGLEPEWICPDSSFSELNCVAGKRMNARVNTVSWGDLSFMNWIGPSVLYNTFSHPSFLLSIIQSVSSCAMVMNCNSSGLPPLSKTKCSSSMLIHNRDDNVLCNISLCPFRHQRAREWGLLALLTYMPEGRWFFYAATLNTKAV